MQMLESELKQLIVEALMLDDVTPEAITSDAPLFGDGLGLDSIDALELAIAVDRKYGVRIEAKDKNVGEIFASVSSLARHVDANRSKDSA